ncbi:MAG: HAD family hydrolase [Candidatus Planktophila sp.]
MKPNAVTFDIGGIIYSDDVFKRAIYGALEELAGKIDSARFEEIYVGHLKSQSGSLRSKLCLEFLGSLEAKEELMAKATALWKFSDADLYGDAKNCIEQMRAQGYAIGIVANQAATVVDSLTAHGITPLIDFMGVSALVGLEKPNPEIFQQAMSALGCAPEQIIHIGNRLDTDVLPAQALGMRTAWILRGEANPEPSESDLATPDIVLKSLSGIPDAIAAL